MKCTFEPVLLDALMMVENSTHGLEETQSNAIDMFEQTQIHSHLPSKRMIDPKIHFYVFNNDRIRRNTFSFV